MAAEKKLLYLAGRARTAQSLDALRFILLNETFQLVPYRQAVLWSRRQGVMGVSGVSSLDRNSSFVLWIKDVFATLAKSQRQMVRVEPDMLPSGSPQAWAEWLPKHALWVPLPQVSSEGAGLMLCRDEPWEDSDLSLIREWLASWQQAWQLLQLKSSRARFWKSDDVATASATEGGWRKLWSNRVYRYGLLLVLVGLIPVPLTVLAPAEIVPKEPAVIRVPIEGVIEEIYVRPNQMVTQGQPLLKLDLTTLLSQLRVAEQEMQLALTSYRQGILQSLTDVERLSQLAEQDSLTVQRQIQAEYLKQMLDKANLSSPRDGIAIFDNPMQWIGRPVVAGEQVMVIAEPGQVEIEIWLALNDVIEFADTAPVVVHLNASPFTPVRAWIRSIGHEAIQRPDGSYAYRVRASLDDNAEIPRIGMRGTARLSGQRVTLAYWVFRKPMIAVRQFIGL